MTLQSTPSASGSAIPQTIRVGGHLVPIAEVPLMAILNLTPDSFYAASRLRPDNEHDLLVRAEACLTAGAHFLDLGGYSTRPGAADVSVEDELARIIPAVQALRRAFPEARLSIDTFRAEVARAALDAGADLINDVTGGADPAMFATVGAFPGVPLVLMHSRGTPQTMQSLTDYSADGGLLVAMADFFSARIAAARAAGIRDLLLDPGLGFAKTIDQNYWLLTRLPHLQAVLQLPWLVGLSRKGMTYRPAGLGPTAADALPATTALHALALWHGAAILRVHDVDEARQAVIATRLTQAAT
jgi:dihydropteroate synthase